MDKIPTLFGYTNYRKFLGDYYEARKSSKEGYSHRQFCKDAGFTSPNVLKHAIEGTRNLTLQSIEQFIVGLGLDGKKAEYFRNLVLMNQAQTDDEKQLYFERLQQAMPFAQRYELDGTALEYIQHWLYPVIREMIHNETFKDDPYWIKRRLTGNADIKQISHGLNLLKKNRFIYKNESGKYVAKTDVVISSDEIRSLAIRGYYRSVMEQSMAMLQALPVEQREYGALIFYLSQSDIPELKAKLKTFLNELHQWALTRNKDDGSVMQFLFQMYPQTVSLSSLKNEDKGSSHEDEL